MYILQLTKRAHDHYQLELFDTHLQVRKLVSPRFTMFDPAKFAYDNVVEELNRRKPANAKIRKQLLSFHGQLFTLHPSTIFEEISFTT